jgi:hypothetical protein
MQTLDLVAFSSSEIYYILCLHLFLEPEKTQQSSARIYQIQIKGGFRISQRGMGSTNLSKS